MNHVSFSQSGDRSRNVRRVPGLLRKGDEEGKSMKTACVLWSGLIVLATFSTGCAAVSYLGYRISPDYPEDATETIELRGPLRQ